MTGARRGAGSIQRRNGRWRARYWGPDHRQRSQTFARRVDAERWLSTQQADVARGDWTDPQRGRMTFARWVERWEETIVHLRPTTRELNVGVARNYLVPRFGSAPLSSITTADVQAMLLEELTEGRLSNSAVRRHVIVMSTIMAAAVSDGRTRRNPCRDVKLPAEASRQMRFLEPAEVTVLADAIAPHYRPLVLTAAYVGLRWGELAGLQLSNVDLLRKQVRVERQLLEVRGGLEYGPPKTAAGVRTVSIPGSLVDVLALHFAGQPVQASDLAFPAPGGGPMRRSNFSRVWRRTVDGTPKRPGVFQDTPLAGLVFHELRHTAAALAIAAGAHPLVVKKRLGHSSITVTMDRYGGLFPRLDAALAEDLDVALRGSLG